MKFVLAYGAALAALAIGPASAQDMTPHSSFKDCEHCPEMVVIPPGEFMMGSDNDLEAPRHKVTIGYSFAIGAFEVTIGEYARFVEETGFQSGGVCVIRTPDKGKLKFKYTGTLHPDNAKYSQGPNLAYIADGVFNQPGYEHTDRHPATCLSRDEAKAYLDWLSERTGKRYRLPTEAEWEYATRAGSETQFFWGKNPNEACKYANHADKASVYQAWVASGCSEKVKPVWAAPAGSYEANPWGLFDTIGNVQEMLEDCWHKNYNGAPADGSPWMDEGCTLFIARGGDYELPAVVMRSAERLFYGISEDIPDPHVRYNLLGFRAAVSLGGGAWDGK